MRGRVTTFILTLAATAALATVASAQPPASQSPELLRKLYACADIADPAARLACFDQNVGSLKTAESQGQFAAVDAAGVRQIEREAFGFSLPSLPRLTLPSFARSENGGDPAPAQTTEVTMTITRLGRSEGRPAFVMSNGQTWAQIDGESNRLARPGETVTVRRAALGSYLMKVERGGAALRVRRVE